MNGHCTALQLETGLNGTVVVQPTYAMYAAYMFSTYADARCRGVVPASVRTSIVHPWLRRHWTTTRCPFLDRVGISSEVTGNGAHKSPYAVRLLSSTTHVRGQCADNAISCHNIATLFCGVSHLSYPGQGNAYRQQRMYVNFIGEHSYYP